MTELTDTRRPGCSGAQYTKMGKTRKQPYFRIQSAVLDHDQARFIHRWGEKESLFRRQHMQCITCADRRSSVRDNPSRKWLLVFVVQEHHNITTQSEDKAQITSPNSTNQDTISLGVC
jgi:hypothetical protein